MKALRFLRALPLAAFLLGAPLRAEQGTIVGPTVGPKTMTEVMTTLNAALLAIQSCNSGTSAPANGPGGLPKAFQCWADTSAAPVVTYKTYDGASWVAFGQLNTSTHIWTPYRNGALIAAVATSSSAADLTTGTLPAARLPVPTASTLGGVQSKTCSASQWINEISTSGVSNCAQPNFTDLAGTAALVQLPAFSGMTAAAAATDADTFPTNQGAGNLKQTLAAIKTWIKAWVVKADVGLGNVDNTSDTTKWAAAKTLTNTTFNCGSTGNVCTVRLASDITGFGTGVATALGVNIGSAGAPVLFNGALGTPSSGVATNLTGTASGLTAGNVTTNANLTGEVTSVGNATTVTNSSVISKLLTSFASGAGTVSSSDSILAALQKIVGNVALKADLAGPTFTGIPRAPTASPSNNSTQLATTAYVDTQVAGGVSGVGSYNNRTGVVTAIGTDVPLRGYISGLTLSAAGATATFGITAGVSTDSTNVSMMSLASSYTKTASAWAVGSGNGALDTSTIAINNWYYVYQIQRPDTGVVDICISASPTAPTFGGNIPAAYTLYRRIGAILTDTSSQWRKFSQIGDEFLWDVPSRDMNGGNIATGPGSLVNLLVPNQIKVRAFVAVEYGTAGTVFGLVTSPDQADTAAGVANFNMVGSATNTNAMFYGEIRTNASGQIRVRTDVAITGNAFVFNRGWSDTRGKDS